VDGGTGSVGNCAFIADARTLRAMANACRTKRNRLFSLAKVTPRATVVGNHRVFVSHAWRLDMDYKQKCSEIPIGPGHLFWYLVRFLIQARDYMKSIITAHHYSWIHVGLGGDGGFPIVFGGLFWGGSYQIRILMYPDVSWMYPDCILMCPVIHQDTFVSLVLN